MPNNNHETYDGVDICTYTDAITISNPLSEDQVNASVLSAGVPYGAANAWIKVERSTALDEPNSNNPFENGPSGLAVIHDTSELIEIPVTNYERYYHVIYRADSAVATSLFVKKYRNVLTITPRTATVGAATVNFYEWTITTQYGKDNDWSNSVLSPQRVINVSGDLSTIPMSGHHDQIFGQSEFSGLGGRFVIGRYITALSAMNGGTTTPTNAPYIKADDWVYALESQTDYHVVHNTYYDKWIIGDDQGGGGGFHAHGMMLITSIDFILMQCAICGLKFNYNGTDYKPIVSGGVVTGYTSDMTEKSEWDEWEDIGDHIIPIDPTPVPPPSGDDDDYADMGIGVGTNVGGLTNYAIMSIRDLATLLADFNEHLETGMSIQNNFVCLYKLGPLSSFLCNTSVRAIVMSANAKKNFVSVDDYSVVSGQKGHHYFGSYNVQRFTNTFYDFSPYSTYELFIPCCGWVPLPDTVAGRKIDVYLIFDLASCTCKGVVRISGTTIAEVSGVLGSSVPFYMIEHGMERLAQVTAITQTLSSLAVGGVGAASGNAGVAAYGLSQLTQSLNDLNVAGNTNFTAIKGGNSDMSAMGNGEYCTIKVTHPVIDEVVNNSMFGHSVGYLCNTIGKLSSFTGFTVCGNPHVTFSASAEEREEIERLLSMGVIL